jgi:hypothetical protein
VKKVLNVLGSVVVVAGMLVFGYLKWWSVAGQDKMGGSCSTRMGCRSEYCLEHVVVGSGEQHSDGYCTAACEHDDDCDKDMACVVPTQAALDDLPHWAKVTKLCERKR